MKKILCSIIVLLGIEARAVITTPFAGYTLDIVGEVSTNAVTIEAWASTNTITGVATNLVLNFTKTYYPDTNGYFTGILQPGNYRLTVAGLTRGAVFGISSSGSTQYLAQLAGIPIYAFQNFTVAQFSDAGSAAYSNANVFLQIANIPTTSGAYLGSNNWILHSDTNWPLSRITNAGSAAFQGSNNWVLHSDTNWPLDRITNAGTAGYSNSAAFLDLVNTQSVAGIKELTNDLNILRGALVGTAPTNWLYNATNNTVALAMGGGALGPRTNFITSTPSGLNLYGYGVSLALGPSAIFLGGNIDLGSYNISGDNFIIDTNGFTGDGSAISNISPFRVNGNVLTNATAGATLDSLRLTGTNSFSDLALRRRANTSLANGVNAAVLVGTNSFVQVSGPSAAFTIAGLDGSPNRDGQLAIIVNLTGYDMTVAHDSGGDPTAANRIYTMTGADRATTGNGAAVFIYNTSVSRWLNVSFDP